MSKIKKIKVTSGVYWVEIDDADLRVLCGCPADAVKHMKKRGLVEEKHYGDLMYETGPNAILLSDVLRQNGDFANLTEFPVLQMLYLQGMLIPNHPNNKGIMPMLIGAEDQLNAQMEYIFRGNYGLISKEEILECGISEKLAEQMMRIKLKFAFGNINPSDKLLDKRIVGTGPTELRGGVVIERIDFNKFSFTYEDECEIVDLNLAPGQLYEAPYQLGYHHIKREYFAVIHSGEGDGWDINRPCMAGILIFQGKIYLIDAGPNILTTLNYLGISVNEIEGIFHTHAHDDHFAGLTTLIRTDKRFKYYSTKLVRKAVTKKLCALMSIGEENFTNFFDIHDLNFDQWSNVNGLDVKPVYSPHPVETNIFFFRANWNNHYKVYAHLADVVSFDVFRNMLTKEEGDGGVAKSMFAKVKAYYQTPTDLKKIDIGGGLIHGQAEDFRGDPSRKIVLAHTHEPLTMKQREIGSSAAFGMVDVLIPAMVDYLQASAREYLNFYFPGAPEYETNYLLNHPVRQFNAGTILYKKGVTTQSVYLLLTGSVEFMDSKSGEKHTLPAGSLIGFYSGYLGLNATETYWASSNITVLELPNSAYHEFVSRNNLYSDLKKLESGILFLENTWLFGEVVSFPILTKVAKAAHEHRFNKGEILQQDDGFVHIIIEGQVNIKSDYTEDIELEDVILKEGDFFGTDSVLYGDVAHCSFEVSEDTRTFAIPARVVAEIPIVYWKMLEVHEKRIRKFYGRKVSND